MKKKRWTLKQPYKSFSTYTPTTLDGQDKLSCAQSGFIFEIDTFIFFLFD